MMKRVLLLWASIIFLPVVPITVSQEKTGLKTNAIDSTAGLLKKNAPTEQKRSAIIEVDGYAFLAEDKTLRQLRTEAIANAKREAMERSQTYIKSFTQVKNFMLSYDLIESAAEGYVRIIDSKDYGIGTDSRYRYWIKAEIEYELKQPEKASRPTIIFQNPDDPLTVQVWTERAGYAEGEQLRIFMQGNKDFHARIIYVDVAGNIVQLLPNKYRSSNRFISGRAYQIPDSLQGDRFRLVIRPPFGSEQIIVYASTTMQDPITMEEVGNGLHQYRGTKQALNQQARSIELVESEGSVRTAEFYEATWDVHTHKR